MSEWPQRLPASSRRSLPLPFSNGLSQGRDQALTFMLPFTSHVKRFLLNPIPSASAFSFLFTALPYGVLSAPQPHDLACSVRLTTYKCRPPSIRPPSLSFSLWTPCSSRDHTANHSYPGPSRLHPLPTPIANHDIRHSSTQNDVHGFASRREVQDRKEDRKWFFR